MGFRRFGKSPRLGASPSGVSSAAAKPIAMVEAVLAVEGGLVTVAEAVLVGDDVLGQGVRNWKSRKKDISHESITYSYCYSHRALLCPDLFFVFL